MASLLGFYVCAIGLYVVIEGHHQRRPFHIEKEPKDGLRHSFISVEPNNRIDEDARRGFIESDAKWMRSETDAMEDRLDEASNKHYRSNKERKYTKCAKSKRSSCKILHRRITRDREREKALRQRDLLTSWSNQLGAVEKFLGQMKEAQRKGKKKSDFQELLEEIEMKRTRETTVTPVTIADKSMPEEFSDILNVIDETDVRTALKEDPFIRRILEMNRRKKEKFVGDLHKNNITLPKG